MDSYRWIPWAFAASLGVVVVVNGAMAYLATTTSTGLVTEHPYTDGTEYNRVLAAAAASDALGWHEKLGFAATAGARDGDLFVELSDRSGAKLDGLSVKAVVVRPVEPLPDIDVPLAETEAGHYQAHLALSRPGQWEVRVAARRGDDIFQFAQRIIVK